MGFPVQSKAVTPKYSACLGGWALGVSSYSGNPDAAAYAVMWLTNRENVANMQINGRQHASRLSQKNNPELLAVNPHVKAIVEILEKSVIFYHGVEGAQIGEMLNVRIAQAVSGELTPEIALQRAITDIQPYIN
jgi:ABC-type glycerol-3-phosphate transport system substrate-binding protein